MSATTHTPGPWTLNTERGWIVDAKHGCVTAYDCSLRDAKLIASAPDLLETLNALAFSVSHLIHGDGRNGKLVENDLRNALQLTEILKR